MVSWRSHASGTIMSTACGRGRPARVSNSSASSKRAVSDPPGVQIGSAAGRSSMRSLVMSASRARIQFSLPRAVLISPLCAT